MKLAGILLIVIGVLALVYQTVTYTKTEKDLQIGSLTVQHQQPETVFIPPVVGGVCIVAGVVALAMGARSKF